VTCEKVYIVGWRVCAAGGVICMYTPDWFGEIIQFSRIYVLTFEKLYKVGWRFYAIRGAISR